MKSCELRTLMSPYYGKGFKTIGINLFFFFFAFKEIRNALDISIIQSQIK